MMACPTHLPPGAGCSESGFGSCVVTDAAVAGQCPYSLLLTSLTADETYYIRVAALGDVDAQAVNPTGDPPDNTNWSGVIEAVPANQPPSSPGPVSLYVLDGSTLQLHMEVPAESGGAVIDEYLIDVDTVSTFSSEGLVTITVVAGDVRRNRNVASKNRVANAVVADVASDAIPQPSWTLCCLAATDVPPLPLASTHTSVHFPAGNPVQRRQRRLQHP